MPRPEKVIRYCETRVDKEAAKVATKVTLDLTDLTDADIYEYAYRGIIIRAQNGWRTAGSIPKEITIKVPKPGTKGVIQMSDEDALKRLIPDDAFRAKLIEKHGGVENAIRAVRKVAEMI